jgi:hypothetical protein
VLTGLDVLEEQDFSPLKGKKIGLITTRRLDREGRRNVDRMLAAGVQVVALFSPSTDSPESKIARTWMTPRTPRPVSESGAFIRKKIAALPRKCCGHRHAGLRYSGCGARFYTYVSTMAYALEEAGARGIPIYVLDGRIPLPERTWKDPFSIAAMNLLSDIFQCRSGTG